IIDQRVGNSRHVQGGGEQNRRLDFTQFVDLSRASQLAECVADEYGARHFLLEEITRMGKHGGYSGADIRSPCQRWMSDRHTRDIGDGIQRSDRKNTDRQTYVPGTRALALLD